ncbi:hypothetical protein ACFQFH_14485 [Halobaculum halobium]|uniref:PEP-CTERM protein-sorting domain-containing protein n=1 Tax=Halobaculum halobium TaxID=3032281 RepID=A0ABD5THS0_9EURY|nr:hypothetical protein [Halobaculum sp. SYNS20]
MPRQDESDRGDTADGADGVDAEVQPFGDNRMLIAGGVTLVGAVAGNLVVQVLVAEGTLPSGADEATLPVFAAVAVVGLVVLVGSFLRR